MSERDDEFDDDDRGDDGALPDLYDDADGAGGEGGGDADGLRKERSSPVVPSQVEARMGTG